jgi:medium-chain acyl-[acyl-carrier-protein] hydrolase
MISQSDYQWFTCSHPNTQASLRLFCFPYAGGRATLFRNWASLLPSTVEVCAIELPGRGIRLKEPKFTRLAPLVQAIAQVILPYLDRPFAFFGHSMGSLIGFELARLLDNQYQQAPACLFVSGRCAPQVQQSNPPIHNLPEVDFLEALRRLNGTPTEILNNIELMQMLVPNSSGRFCYR